MTIQGGGCETEKGLVTRAAQKHVGVREDVDRAAPTPPRECDNFLILFYHYAKSTDK